MGPNKLFLVKGAPQFAIGTIMEILARRGYSIRYKGQYGHFG